MEAPMRLRPGLAQFETRSPGTKLFVVILLALFMSIAGLFVQKLTSDRAMAHGIAAAVAGNAAQPGSVLGIHLVDSYRATTRSLRYITLFLGLVFLTYFLFEIKSRIRLHPAQYALVGLAQITFYLLLLSLAERIGFDLSFLIAGTCTIALLSVNTAWVFASRVLARRAAAVFTLVYLLIYVLLRIEAYALIVGAFSSFAAIAVAMYMTRGLDWYGARIPATPAARGYESFLD